MSVMSRTNRGFLRNEVCNENAMRHVMRGRMRPGCLSHAKPRRHAHTHRARQAVRSPASQPRAPGHHAPQKTNPGARIANAIRVNAAWSIHTLLKRASSRRGIDGCAFMRRLPTVPDAGLRAKAKCDGIRFPFSPRRRRVPFPPYPAAAPRPLISTVRHGQSRYAPRPTDCHSPQKNGLPWRRAVCLSYPYLPILAGIPGSAPPTGARTRSRSTTRHPTRRRPPDPPAAAYGRLPPVWPSMKRPVPPPFRRSVR